MIQTRTALCVIAATASGLFLYSEKRQALMVDRETAGLMRASADLHARTAMLRAEWAAMLGPDQLQAMIAEHLTLAPIAPAQFVRLDDLRDRLPPPEAQPATDSDAQADPDATASTTTPSEPATAPSPVRPAAPEVLAGSVPPHAAAHRPADAGVTQQAALSAAGLKSPQKPLGRRSPVQHSLVLAGGSANGPVGAFNRPMMTRPVAANTYRAIARPLRAADAGGSPPAREQTRPAVTSALSSGVALPPPIPYGQ